MTEQPTDRTTWLAQRRLGIGASDAAAVCGVDPFRSPYHVWAEKTGLVEPDNLAENEAVEWGIRLEGAILAAFGEKTERSVWPHKHESLVSKEHAFMRATPDGYQIAPSSEIGLVQIKTTSAHNLDDWRDGPPVNYQVQVQHEMLVCDLPLASLVVLIGGNRLRYFDVERNQKFCDALIERERLFWASVESRTPPEIDGSDSTARTLSRLHPADDGSEVELPAELNRWLVQWDEARQMKKAAEAAIQEAHNHIVAAIGSSTYGVMPDGLRLAYRTQERAAHEVKGSTFRVLRKVK